MNPRKNILFAFILLGIAIAILFTFFKIDNVPDVKNGEKYDFTSEGLSGFQVFDQVLKKWYKGSQFQKDYAFDPINYPDSNYVYLATGNELNFSKNESIDLESFLSNGNTVVLLAQRITFDGDSIHLNPYDVESLNLTDTFRFNDHINYTDFVFQKFKGTLDTFDYLDVNRYRLSQDSAYLSVLVSQGSFPIFQKMDYGQGKLLIHCMPQLFTNYASKQSFYVDHMNALLQEMNGDTLILSKPGFDNGNKDSPLKVILSIRAFRTAYYILLFSLIIYVIFASKRTQRPIGILPKIKNTTLEYVDTLSRLFIAQRQHNEVVKKMENNFYHYVKKHYYIQANDDAFISLLSRRTKVNPSLINAIINAFEGIDAAGQCSEDQLLNLNKNIINFKQLANDGRV